MSADTENFPRGGKRVNPNEVKRKHEENLFSHNKEPKPKKARKERHSLQADEFPKEENWLSSLKLRGTLTYNKIQDGMVVLACIKQISNLVVHVEFPGNTHGRVPINCISDKFTEVISESIQSNEDFVPSAVMNKVLSVGQLVVTKIMGMKNGDKGCEVHASFNPKDVYGGLPHTAFKKGATLWAYIVSELDHGYELSVGIKNCRIFLPFKNVDEGVQYHLGQPLFCVIHKCENSQNNVTTLTVNAKRDLLDKGRLNEAPNIDVLIPGTKAELVVTEVLPTGIKGKFFDDFKAYLDGSHLFSKLKLEKIHPASVIEASVLFVEPITKIVYLTLRGLEILPDPKYEIGQYVTVEIAEHLPHGMSLKFGKTETGFITNNRLGNTVGKSLDSEAVEGVRAKFKIGSTHRSRIIHFNRLEQVYICTFESKILKEMIFSHKDLHLGLKVNVTVHKVVQNGLVVKAGHVQGFVPNMHLANTEFTPTIKGKFKEGQSVPARVLSISEKGNVLFTVKPALLEAEKCLTDLKDAIKGSQFVGFVVFTARKGALVAFFGSVTGWISERQLNSEGIRVDPRNYFFRGQVVNVYSMGAKNGKLNLSLTSLENDEVQLEKGRKYKKAMIASINKIEKKKKDQGHNGIDGEVSEEEEMDVDSDHSDAGENEEEQEEYDDNNDEEAELDSEEDDEDTELDILDENEEVQEESDDNEEEAEIGSEKDEDTALDIADENEKEQESDDNYEEEAEVDSEEGDEDTAIDIADENEEVQEESDDNEEEAEVGSEKDEDTALDIADENEKEQESDDNYEEEAEVGSEEDDEDLKVDVDVCTFQSKILKREDLHSGLKVNVKVVKIGLTGLYVKAGRVYGFIPNMHLGNRSNPNPHLVLPGIMKKRFKRGQTLQARVLGISPKGKVFFTIKPALLRVEDEKCLTDLKDAIKGSEFVGFVIRTRLHAGALVAFFGNVKGWISEAQINSESLCVDPHYAFFIGQVVNVCSMGVENGQLNLSLTSQEKDKMQLNLKKLFEKVVITSIDNIEKKKTGEDQEHNGNGGEVSEEKKSIILKKEDLHIGLKVKVKVIKFVASGLVVKAGYVEGLIPNMHQRNKANPRGVLPYRIKQQFRIDQNLKARVLKISENGNVLFTIKSALVKAKKCLTDVKDAIKGSQFVGFVIHTIWAGVLVAFFGEVTGWLSEAEINSEGLCVDPRDYFFHGEVVNVCSMGVENGQLNLSLTPWEKNKMQRKLQKRYNKARITSINNIEKKKTSEDQEHNGNDGEVSEEEMDVDGDHLDVDENAKHVESDDNDEEEAVLDSEEDDEDTALDIPDENEEVQEESDDNEEEAEVGSDEDIEDLKVNIATNEESDSEDEMEIKDEPLDDSEEEIEEVEIKPTESKIKSEQDSRPILSGVSSFYSTDNDVGNLIKREDSSSEDDDDENEQKPKKKKLTAAERVQLNRQEEERLTRIENELASSIDNPQSADQFDRLLLANPNSSELWLKYIAMHIATTELDKARAVGRRALETIDMTQIKEKFNIWIALLNLENLYGTKESLDTLFNEAVRYNDSLEVYLNVIKMLASSGKLSEMEEKIRKVRGKEKQNTRMWLEVGQTYYTLGQFREARNIKEAALKSILDKKRQFDLIVKFGIMEFQSGELAQAVANFETILETYPAKVNIWIIYVDQLIKKQKVEEARKVLEKAIGQKLPPKSMKSLFQKFLHFEELHGTRENIEIVERKAKAYVDSVTKR